MKTNRGLVPGIIALALLGLSAGFDSYGYSVLSGGGVLPWPMNWMVWEVSGTFSYLAALLGATAIALGLGMRWQLPGADVLVPRLRQWLVLVGLGGFFGALVLRALIVAPIGWLLTGPLAGLYWPINQLLTLVMLVFLTLALAGILLPSFVARDGQPVATRKLLLAAALVGIGMAYPLLSLVPGMPPALAAVASYSAFGIAAGVLVAIGLLARPQPAPNPRILAWLGGGLLLGSMVFAQVVGMIYEGAWERGISFPLIVNVLNPIPRLLAEGAGMVCLTAAVTRRLLDHQVAADRQRAQFGRPVDRFRTEDGQPVSVDGNSVHP